MNIKSDERNITFSNKDLSQEHILNAMKMEMQLIPHLNIIIQNLRVIF